MTKRSLAPGVAPLLCVLCTPSNAVAHPQKTYSNAATQPLVFVRFFPASFQNAALREVGEEESQDGGQGGGKRAKIEGREGLSEIARAAGGDAAVQVMAAFCDDDDCSIAATLSRISRLQNLYFPHSRWLSVAASPSLPATTGATPPKSPTPLCGA